MQDTQNAHNAHTEHQFKHWCNKNDKIMCENHIYDFSYQNTNNEPIKEELDTCIMCNNECDNYMLVPVLLTPKKKYIYRNTAKLCHTGGRVCVCKKEECAELLRKLTETKIEGHDWWDILDCITYSVSLLQNEK